MLANVPRIWCRAAILVRPLQILFKKTKLNDSSILSKLWRHALYTMLAKCAFYIFQSWIRQDFLFFNPFHQTIFFSMRSICFKLLHPKPNSVARVNQGFDCLIPTGVSIPSLAYASSAI